MKLRTFISMLFIAVAAFLLQSCCKAYCGVETFSIRFINYKTADIDSLLFIKYTANGRFDQKIDSFYQYDLSTQADTMYRVFTQNVEYNKDWKIKILSTNRAYSLTEIKTANEKCICENNTYKIIAAYRLDGTIYNNDIFDLRK